MLTDRPGLTAAAAKPLLFQSHPLLLFTTCLSLPSSTARSLRVYMPQSRPASYFTSVQTASTEANDGCCVVIMMS